MEFALKEIGCSGQFLQLSPFPNSLSAHLVVERAGAAWVEFQGAGKWAFVGQVSNSGGTLLLVLPESSEGNSSQSQDFDQSLFFVLSREKRFRFFLPSGALHGILFADSGSQSGSSLKESLERSIAKSRETRAALPSRVVESCRAATTEAGKIDAVSSSHHRIVNRACDRLDQQSGEKHAMGVLATSTGVSVRTLERAFENVCGISPSRYLLARRLNAAYRKLLVGKSGRKSVTEIAHEVGFTHLGRFSANFRTWFGESPKETLQRNYRRDS